MGLCCNVVPCSVLYCFVLYCDVVYWIVLLCIVLFCIGRAYMVFCVVLHCSVLSWIVVLSWSRLYCIGIPSVIAIPCVFPVRMLLEAHSRGVWYVGPPADGMWRSGMWAVPEGKWAAVVNRRSRRFAPCLSCRMMTLRLPYSCALLSHESLMWGPTVGVML